MTAPTAQACGATSLHETLGAIAIPTNFACSADPGEEFFRGLERAPLGLRKFEFRWHKFTTKCLGENVLSNVSTRYRPSANRA